MIKMAKIPKFKPEKNQLVRAGFSQYFETDDLEELLNRLRKDFTIPNPGNPSGRVFADTYNYIWCICRFKF